jgi:hypothetical protein
MQRFLIGIKDAEDVDGVGGFIDCKGDQEGKQLHGLAAGVSIADGRSQSTSNLWSEFWITAYWVSFCLISC